MEFQDSEVTPILLHSKQKLSATRIQTVSAWWNIRMAVAVVFASALAFLVTFAVQPKVNEVTNSPTRKVEFIASQASSTNTTRILSQRNSYTQVDSNVLKNYGIEILLEPDVVNILRIDRTSSDLASVDWDLTAVKIASNQNPTVQFKDGMSNGTEVGVIVSPANTVFKVTVTFCTAPDECSSLVEMATVKYVRREIRSLTDDDREAYFEAVEKIFFLSQEEGQALYGKRFSNHDVMAGLHDTKRYKYHGNLNFLTSHPAMQLRYENSLLAINKNIALPYWDFLLDAPLGKRWGDSPVYSPDWFGPTFSNTADDESVPIVSGRFEGMKRVYDPNYHYEDTYHTLFGFLGIPYSSNREMYVTRSGSTCGFQATQGFSNCQHVQECFQEYLSNHSLYDFDDCLEIYVHANLHAMHAGMWDCPVDWNEFYSENSDWLSDELFSLLGYHQIDLIERLYDAGYLTCPTSCDLSKSNDEKKSCSCRSNVTGIHTADDIDNLDTNFFGKSINEFYEAMYDGAFGGRRFISKTPRGYYIPTGIAKENLEQLNKLMLKTSLFPGGMGDMISGAAANDPLFWVMHEIFDKATHALRLSPHYNTRRFDWDQDDDGTEGEGWTSNSLFKYTDFEPYLGNHHVQDKQGGLTNQMLWELLKPDGDSIPYIYDQMTEWGRCHFDPMMTPP